MVIPSVVYHLSVINSAVILGLKVRDPKQKD